MNKFILISFGFLGWAFYEMSGGEDFEPASVRMAHLIPAVEKELPTPEAVIEAPIVVAEREPSIVDTDPPLIEVLDEDVTRVSLNLNALEEAIAETVGAETEIAVVTSLDDEIGVPRNAGSLSESANTPAIIPSLIVPNVTTSLAPLTETALSNDIRTVSGNRVNVRGGPSTDFEVVTRLVRGDAVEILEDNGNGWVRMRPLDGGTEGWMADFLLVGG